MVYVVQVYVLLIMTIRKINLYKNDQYLNKFFLSFLIKIFSIYLSTEIPSFFALSINLTLRVEEISYSAKAKRGSKRNPYLKEDDFISVKNSMFGRSTGLIKAVTDPFAGIYSTKKLIEDFQPMTSFS